MRLHDVKITNRMIEELSKLGDTPRSIALVVGCPTKLVQSWLDGINTPSALSLQKFHEIGCDVLYILTGKRYELSGGDTDV